MSAISIGIQTIMPRTATTPQTTPQQQANERETDTAQSKTKPTQPPPLPEGQGQFVDRYA